VSSTVYPAVYEAAIAQAVDDYLLMERDARRYRLLRESLGWLDRFNTPEEVDTAVDMALASEHPAQSSAPADR
jgi:hypothetical protein